MSNVEKFKLLSTHFAPVQSAFDPAIGPSSKAPVFLSNPTFWMQAIRRIVPRFARTISHGPQVIQRPSTPARSLLQQRLYTEDGKRLYFPYWSEVLLRDGRLRALPYKERLDYIVTNSASGDVAPSPRILIRGLDRSTNFLDIEKSSVLSGHVSTSGSIKKGILYVEFPSQEAALGVMQKINSATEYPFAVEGGSSNVVLPAYAEYAKNRTKHDQVPSKFLFIPGYRGTLDELRAMLERFSQDDLRIAEHTTRDGRYIWADLGSEENAKSALESCARRIYSYEDGKQAILSIYYDRGYNKLRHRTAKTSRIPDRYNTFSNEDISKS